MSRQFCGISRHALLLSIVALAAPLPAIADDFVVPSGTTDTVAKTVTGTDTGTVEAGGTLAVDGDAVNWEGPLAAPGVTINNFGNITSTDRAIDTSNSSTPRNLTLNNYEGALISAESDAFRINASIGNGTVVVNNHGTIVSEGSQALDFANNSSASGTIEINNGATGIIRALDNAAMALGAGSTTVNNSGLIESTATDERAIDLDANLNNVTTFAVYNSEGATIQSNADAIRVTGDNGDTTPGTFLIDNAGTIKTTGTDSGQTIDFNGLESSDATITIINRSTGVISAADADAIRPGEGATITNYGLIMSGGVVGSGDSSDAVDLQGHSATIHNMAGGNISGFRHGITTDVDVTVINEAGGLITGRNGSGVGSDGNGTVTNYGTITGAYAGVGNGDGDGVDIDFFGTIRNYGTIQGTGADGIDNRSEGIAMGGGVIENYSGALISGAHNGILIDDGDGNSGYYATHIMNAGTIRGLDGGGILLRGDFNDVIENSGTISGTNGIALDMGGGDDMLKLFTGSTIVGLADGGADTDTVRLDGVGSLGSTVNFEILDVVSGAWTLTGSHDFATGTVEAGAELIVNGAIAGIITVDDGGLLGGNGTIGGAIVNGTVAPGNSIGTLYVAGDVAFGASAIYQAEINSHGDSDRIVATGSAALNGTVVVLPEAGNFYAGQSFTILTADGGVTGSFAGAISDFVFLTPALGYGANEVTLTLLRNGANFADFARTRNQGSAALALQSAGPGNEAYDTVLSARAVGWLPGAYDSLSGEIHASAVSAIATEAWLVRNAVMDRLRQPFGAVTIAPAPTYVTKAPAAPVLQPDEPYALWIQGVGNWGETKSDGNAARLDRSTGGVFGGFDATMANWRAGIAGGYTQTKFNVDDRASSGTLDSWHIAAYGGAMFGQFAARIGGAYSGTEVSTDRVAAFSTFGDSLNAKYNANTGQVFGEIGYDLVAGPGVVEPFGGLAYVHIDRDRFAETGGAAALAAQDQSSGISYSTLGVRGEIKSNWGASTVTWRGLIGWQHAFGDVDPTAILAFRSGSNPFSVSGVPIARNSAVVEAGLDVAVAANMKLGVSYVGALASSAQDNAVKGVFQIKF